VGALDLAWSSRYDSSAEGALRSWQICGLDTTISWPPKVRSVDFGGHVVVFPTLDEGDAPSIAVAHHDGAIGDPPGGYADSFGEPRCKNSDDAIRLGRRFLSALAWTHRARACVDFEFGSGTLIGSPRQRSLGRVLGPGPDLTYLPDPTEEDGRLALAYYRDGLGLNSEFYQFLSFWKILELRFGNDRRLQQWIDDSTAQVSGPGVTSRIAVLHAKRRASIGARLFESRRCAIAHARHRGHRFDPDEPEHLRRVNLDLPLIRAFAERFIEHELGVDSAAAAARRRAEER
jgi:methylamine utilization protein MauJ